MELINQNSTLENYQSKPDLPLSNTDWELASREQLNANVTSDHMLPDLVIDNAQENIDPKRNRFENVENITIYSDNGNETQVYGIEPGQNQSLYDLLKSLHPNLSAYELDKAYRQTIKYNQDFDNSLDPQKLDPSKKVYLTSVKSENSKGQISSVRRPDGALQEFSYDQSGRLESFQITSASGTILESGQRGLEQAWKVTLDGKTTSIADLSLDSEGNLSLVKSANQTIMLLSNGTKLDINQGDPKQIVIEGRRDGKRVYSKTYTQDSTTTIETVTYFSDGQAPRSIKRVFDKTDISLDNTAPSKKAGELAYFAGITASNMNSLGRCAEGVQLTLAKAGYSQFLGCGHAWQMLNPLKDSGLFSEVEPKQAQAGDIMLRRSANGSYGHIAIILDRSKNGTLKEGSDHISNVNLANPRYSKTVFLRLK